MEKTRWSKFKKENQEERSSVLDKLSLRCPADMAAKKLSELLEPQEGSQDLGYKFES